MSNTRNRRSQLSAFLLGLTTVLVSAAHIADENILSAYIRNAGMGSPLLIANVSRHESYPNTLRYRIAKRLKGRLLKQGTISPGIHVLADAVDERQKLLGHHVTVEFLSPEGEFSEWNVSLQQYPTWIESRFGIQDANFSISEERIAAHLKEHPVMNITPPIDVRFTGTSLSGAVLKARTTGTAKPGHEFNEAELAMRVRNAYEENADEITFEIPYREGQVIYEIDGEEYPLSLLSTGKSNFEGSTYARMSNVRKALNEHVHNVVVPAREDFSFNATLNGSVTIGNGWSMAKVIMNGTELVMSPGGGICQASTTVYRAIVNGGFPVLERRSHSLYVTYYKEHGVGIDATIFPGTQDLVFRNDTDSPLIIQAYDTEDLDAIVNIYGVSDGRSIALEGPYFSSTAPQDIQVQGRPVKGNEIVWKQIIGHQDGSRREELIVSRYLNMPRNLASEFIVQEIGDELAQRN